MKTKYYLLVVLTLLFACQGESQKSASAETSDSMRQENKVVTEASDASKVNIKDIFLLLPDDVFPLEEINIEKRELLLKHIGEDKAYDISPTPIGVCDVKNGYLNLTGMQFGWEMCYWNLKDGRKLVIVNQGTESGSILNYFFYENGKLIEDLNFDGISNIYWKADDFIHLSELNLNTRKEVEQKFARAEYILYYKLPQKGTSIQVTLDTYALMDYSETNEISEAATKEVTLKWENEKWVK
ncbi:MAG: hypothetical protein RBS07_05225 [Lentimicrobium sp.]|jgi:hypothetical protein|nr:hypothetical protein [Lentimicrobium sp.]